MADRRIKIVNGVTYEYELYSLVDNTDSILRTGMLDFDFSAKPVDPKYLSISLIETMLHRYGVGLAAVQVGQPYRVFAMGAGNTAFACFNPKIIEASEDLDSFEEGCLSWKGLYLRIKRPESIKCEYYDFNGVKQERSFSGLTARIFQHELDHLNGEVFIDKVHPINLDKAKRKVKSNLKKLRIQEEQMEKRQIIAEATQKVIKTSAAEKLTLTTENQTLIVGK